MKEKRCRLKKAWIRMVVLLAALVFSAGSVFAEPWKFGIMPDTQWSSSPDNKNPNTVAVSVIKHMNQEFIKHGVKFVVQVGDLVDTGTDINLDVRATFAQDLYNAGIGFYPLRGNHESSASNARRFQMIFPQTQTGVNNQTPNRVPTTIYGPQDNTNTHFTVGGNFNTLTTMEGLTYSFDLDNARFIFLDQFTKPNGTTHSTLNATDVDWVRSRLTDINKPEHAFVFSHKGLITPNHSDNLFGSSPNSSATLTNAFMSHLSNAGVRYLINGHDHIHHRAIVESPDGNYRIQEITAASASYKFYIPADLNTWSTREIPIAQELFTIGYYIVTVDGPNVRVDYYASPNGCNGDCDLTNDIIPYTFTKRESFGYSLNGKQTMVPQGGSYIMSDDTGKAVERGETGYIGTTAAILSGTNGSAGKDYRGRALTKSVNTGWAPKTEGLASDIFILLGMEDSLATDFSDASNPNLKYRYSIRTNQTDTFVLSMSYNPSYAVVDPLGGSFGLVVKDRYRGWVNAVAKNFGGMATFINGPWVEGYGLGTYGIDPVNSNAWAVLNHNGEFAVGTINPANTAPMVSITAPIAYSVYDAPALIPITANVVDDGTIDKVEFFNGLEKIGEATSEPFSISWNGIWSGNYVLRAVATDNEGASAVSPELEIIVKNLDNITPLVHLSSPSDGARLFEGSSIEIQADASDADGFVTMVEFYVGTKKVGEDLTPPYSFNWSPPAVGSYVLKAVARDNDGACSVSISAVLQIIPVPPGGVLDFFENFNSMGSTRTSAPAGWSMKVAGGGSNSTWVASIPSGGTNSVAAMVNASANLTAVTTPASTNNNGYNAAASGNTSDRMLATSPTSVAGVAIQLRLVNESSGYIDRLMIGYDIYRINATSSVNELPGYWLFYSLDNGTTWVNVEPLNPKAAGSTGIVVPNTVGKTNVPVAPLALSGKWNPGGSILFRWVDDNGVPTSPDQMYGLDNVDIFTPQTLEMKAATSSFVYSRSTKTYSGLLTLTNTSQTPISGNIVVSLTKLTEGVTLQNATGSDNISPYICVTLGQALQPGEFISVPLLFANPANAKINFVPVVYQY